MKILHLVYGCSEDGGEYQGVFNDQRELIGSWSMNDADWRIEYFQYMMATLGYVIENSEDEELIEQLNKVMN